MSLKAGGSSKTWNSTNTTNSNETTTSSLPDWATSVVQKATDRVGSLFDVDPRSLVAPAHRLQVRAANGAAGLTGSPWNYDGAADVMRRAVQAGPNSYDAATWSGAELGPATQARGASVLQNLGAYMSPYRHEVVDAALADYDFGAGQSRAQLDLDLAGSGAFGGSGAAIARSMSEDALTRGRGATSANLRDQMFQRGAAMANLDADRRQQTAMGNMGALNQFALTQGELAQQAGLASLGALNDASRYNAGASDLAWQRRMDAARGLTDISGAYDANQRANIATQAAAGETMRGIDQAQRDAEQALVQRTIASLSSLPLNLFGTQHQSSSSTQTQSGKEKGKNWEAGIKATPPGFGGWTFGG